MMIISLIGPMGSGKSTVGHLMAKRLNYAFADTDAWIETAKGLSINTIFKQKGEAYFRACENEALTSLLQQQNLILATGGGIITSPKSRTHLKQTKGVYLQVSIAVQLERLQHDNSRPLLGDINRKATLTRLQSERSPWYHRLATFTTNTDQSNPDAVTTKIITALGLL